MTAGHLRILCESEWNGGGGKSIEEVGNMSLDQIWFHLCDKDLLRGKPGGRTKTIAPAAVTGIVQEKDGMIRGRAADGTPIMGRVQGKSKARMLMEAAEAKKLKEFEKKGRKRGKKKRGN